MRRGLAIGACVVLAGVAGVALAQSGGGAPRRPSANAAGTRGPARLAPPAGTRRPAGSAGSAGAAGARRTHEAAAAGRQRAAGRHGAAGRGGPVGRAAASGHRTPPPAWACPRAPAPPPVPEHPITHPEWLSGVTITEYYPAPERWFVGRRVSAPGVTGTFAVDWLYGPHGLAMEGQGVDLQGRPVHIAALGSTGWVNDQGRPTVAVCLGKWTDGFPAWLRGGWRNARGEVTFPLATGGWSNGTGVKRLDYGGVTFAPGESLPLRYYHSIAVDPRLIPFGSRVYIPAYHALGGGWFVAQDTGGAIKGRHVDVYRPAPVSPADLGRYFTGQRIYVIPPG